MFSYCFLARTGNLVSPRAAPVRKIKGRPVRGIGPHMFILHIKVMRQTARIPNENNRFSRDWKHLAE